jgi:hypothetical protein
MGSINSLSSSYLQSMLGTALQGIGLTNNTTANSLNSIGTSSVALPADNQQLSPFAQMMSMLQQLEQSDPTKYQQVTQQIATNLQNAAQTAQTDGNSTAAAQLGKLASDFNSASQSGQLPNIQDLAQAIGGGHHHHHHAHAASGDADGDSGGNNGSSGTSTSSSASQTASQFLSLFQSNSTQNDALNPAAIIMNTLSTAGISGS